MTRRLTWPLSQFGAILAVSRANSPRGPDLEFAANITSLAITVPSQPQWTEADVQRFRTPGGASRISRGSALAWLGHLHALREFLASPLETALIIEDDVDWDVHLRTVQVPLAARAYRQYSRSILPRPSSGNSTSPVAKAEDEEDEDSSAGDHYWGDLSTWEIMYLGHCGDFFPAETFPSTPHLTFRDDTLPPASRLFSRTAAFLKSVGVPQRQRVLHASRWPLCTFGYAVTRASAQRLLDTYGTEGKGGCVAYDVRVLEACRDDGWACTTVTPELFHHVTAQSLISSIDRPAGTPPQQQQQQQQQAPAGGSLGAEAAKKHAEEEADREAARDDYDRRTGSVRVKPTPETQNIACGARSAGFRTRDPEVRAFLREEVGERGNCIVDLLEEIGEEDGGGRKGGSEREGLRERGGERKLRFMRR